MTLFKNKYRVESTRLPGYDYSQCGAYFITIVTHGRKLLFGEITDGEMLLNNFGELVRNEWEKTGVIRPNIIVDECIVMPNHIHGILIITDNEQTHDFSKGPNQIEQFGKPTSNSIPTIVRLFKSSVTKQINIIRQTPGHPVWQRNYHEHVVRNDEELNSIRQYIIDNPENWLNDENYVDGPDTIS